jgi:hypothetical protein
MRMFFSSREKHSNFKLRHVETLLMDSFYITFKIAAITTREEQPFSPFS